MKGNYYLFEPLLDEKGEQMVRRPRAYEYFVYNEFVGTSYGLGNTEYPILTMKKFDNIKDLKEYINGEEVEGK